MKMKMLHHGAWLVGLFLAAQAVQAVESPAVNTLAPAPFKTEVLNVSDRSAPSDHLSDARYRNAARRLGTAESAAMIDRRTGRFTTLMPGTPLIPGSGFGNSLQWAKAPADTQARAEEVGRAFRGWLLANADALNIHPEELVEQARVSPITQDYYHIHQPRRIDGIPVRDAAIVATVKFGNLILVGLIDWGDVQKQTPALDIAQAADALARGVVSHAPGPMWKNPELVYVPVATPDGGVDGSSGLGYRLAYALYPRFADPQGRFEALVDARNGEVLSIQDTIHYAASVRSVAGGVFPVSNNGIGPGGTEQAAWPMPFIDVTTPSGTLTTDLGGTLSACVNGEISASLRGPYVAIADVCGASSLAGSGNLDFGVSAGTDCATPGIGGPGNTHAARTGFHELNMVKAMARSHLPENVWLQQRITANMNISQTCNASWDGSAVNFRRSGGGCGNTGEIAGVFDHEWGHGLDNNDGVPSVSSPGEGIADLYAAIRLGNSCIGPGFQADGGNSLCSSQAPPAGACTACSGVRDLDFEKHVGQQPFTVAQADSCGVASSNGPCGGSVHCEGLVYSQAVWDLWKRDLPSNHGVSDTVAHELVAQLTFHGAHGVDRWFTCNNGTAGCSNPAGCGCESTSGYMQYLAADDDDGNLANGTPHMAAIFAAFNRHQIACTTPVVTTAGCPSTPTDVPVVTATPGDGSISLSWTPASGAASYRVYRTDGVFGCDFGKTLIGTVTDTSFIDLGLMNGRDYSYTVIPTGTNESCFQVASTCTTAQPTPGIKLGASPARASFTPKDGDGDLFVDNCEFTNVSMPIDNLGAVPLTNVRVIAVSSPSHPGSQVLTQLPYTVAINQASCEVATGSINVIPMGLAPGDTFALDITVVSDEIAAMPQTYRVETENVESDLQFFASRTYDFETDAEGWVTTRGTFTRTNDAPGGAGGAGTYYLRSSANLDMQCDAVDSPPLRLTSTSTLSLQTHYDIENQSGGQWWDRANLAAAMLDDGSLRVLSPSGGRTYNASGPGGSCGLDTDPGWANAATSWAASSFTSAALQTGSLASRLMKLRLRYGTDPAANGAGFRFDQVTLTDVELTVPDAQPDVCTPGTMIFKNGFE